MSQEEFLAALVAVGAAPDRHLSDLYHLLYYEEEQAVNVAHEVSDDNIQSLRNEIAVLESAIEETKKNNIAHERCIYACSHLLGNFMIRKEFATSFGFRYQRDKFKRLCELFEAKIDLLRKELAPTDAKGKRRIQVSKHMKDPFYIKVVQELLDSEFCLLEEKQTGEISEIDSEAKAFALVEEVKEYYLIAKRLNLDPPEFSPAESLSAILGCETEEDNNSTNSGDDAGS
jgi:hypothetical protein